MSKLIKLIKLISPICFHDWGYSDWSMLRRCTKCNKEMIGNQIVIKHGDWLFNKRGD